MNMTLTWTVWLFAIVASFACFEAYALATNRTTLSRFVWTVSKKWPPFGWVAGLITGFLACHFWWGGIVCFAPVQ
jgi:hypothetical protein